MIFEFAPLPQYVKEEMIKSNVWSDKCPVHLDRLNLVKFSYYNFSYDVLDDGELVVMDAVASDICMIFKKLFDMKFPIHSAKRIEYYNGSDVASLEDNNTSAFNFRQVSGGGILSVHSYGLAIDLNPIQNPYIAIEDKSVIILPECGKNFLNRVNLRDGMVENVIDIFHNHGFNIWGGRWNTPIDWQHFQVKSSLAKLLSIMSATDAMLMFNYHKTHLNDNLMFEQFIIDYQNDEIKFMTELSVNN